MMDKAFKRELVSKIKDNISNNNFILSGFKGLSVSDLESLRNNLRKFNYSANVVKNRLLLIALKELGIDGFDASLKDTTMLTIQKQHDSFDGFKVLADFAKANEKFFLKSGFVDGKLVDVDDILKISTLPSRDVLLGKLFSGMQSPISRLVIVLNNSIQKLVYVLGAIKNKNN